MTTAQAPSRFDEALIELVVRTGQGLPRGTAAAACDAWAELADAGVLVVIGPGTTRSRKFM